MQEKVNYEELMKILADLNSAVFWSGTEAVRNDCGSLSYRLGTMGLQGTATSVIDSSFNNISQYLGRCYNYITELINWTNTNVIGQYQTTDELLKYHYESALGGYVEGNAYGGYNVENEMNTNGGKDFMSALDNYGKKTIN